MMLKFLITSVLIALIISMVRVGIAAYCKKKIEEALWSIVAILLVMLMVMTFTSYRLFFPEPNESEDAQENYSHQI